jgi:hypothetical protein
MHRGLGLDVVEGDPGVGFCHHAGRDLTGDDFLEDGHDWDGVKAQAPWAPSAVLQ